MSEPVAQAVMEELGKRNDLAAELIDIRKLSFPTDDAGRGIDIPGFSEKIETLDALIIVSPEYNHGYPGLLKHVLDTRLKEYMHRAVGVVGVSRGQFGGARMIENLQPVLRFLGLVPISRDINFGNVYDAFDENGNVKDPAFFKRFEGFINELVWMARTLRYGREHIISE